MKRVCVRVSTRFEWFTTYHLLDSRHYIILPPNLRNTSLLLFRSNTYRTTIFVLISRLPSFARQLLSVSYFIWLTIDHKIFNDDDDEQRKCDGQFAAATGNFTLTVIVGHKTVQEVSSTDFVSFVANNRNTIYL